MTIEQQIEEYLNSQPEKKCNDLQFLHQKILEIMPNGKLWFLDGKNSEGKIISNPNIGYGTYMMKYADGSTKEFYQIGLSGNTTGISVYIIGIEDKKYLVQTFGEKIGKATVSGYCIKFRALKDINWEVLKDAIHYGISRTL